MRYSPERESRRTDKDCAAGQQPAAGVERIWVYSVDGNVGGIIRFYKQTGAQSIRSASQPSLTQEAGLQSASRAFQRPGDLSPEPVDAPRSEADR